MLELYNTVHPYNTKINIAYYSESGWLSFFLNFLFSISPFEYLCFFEDPQRNHPFLSISKINEISIFNQMDLDEKSGFGSVDGAIYFDIGSENYFIFIHTINNKYKEACSIPEKNRLAFNKTINGRIELTYRFCLSVKNTFHKKNPKFINETSKYLHESYIKTDKFYIIPHKKMDKMKFRRIRIKEGREEVFIGRFFREDTKFYFLIITDDKNNPFSPEHPDFSEHYTPRIYPEKGSEDLWEVVKDKFLWLPKSIIINLMMPGMVSHNYSFPSKFCYSYSGIKDFSPEKIAFETREDNLSISKYNFSRLDLWPL